MNASETGDGTTSQSPSKHRYVLPIFLALIVVNLAVRYPYAANLYGTDTFYTTGFAISIGQFGHANWIAGPLNYFGLPAGQPAAVPFLLSMSAQVADVNIIEANLIVTSALTAVTVLGMACLAFALRRHLAFALIAAIVCSLAPRFVTFTINQASTRDLFVALTPVAILFLLKALDNRQQRWTWVALLEGVFALMLAAHHVGALFLFAIAAAVLCIPLGLVLVHPRIPSWPRIPVYAALFGGLLLAPIVHVPGLALQLPNQYTTGRFFSGTSPTPILGNMAVDYLSSSGPLFVLVPVGIASVLRFRNPRPLHLVVPVIVLVFAITFIVGYYVWFLLAAPFAILSAYGFETLRLGWSAPMWRKAAAVTMATVLSCASALIVMDIQTEQSSGLQWDTASTALFLREEAGAMFVVSDALDSSYRMWTVSGRPTLGLSGGPAQIYGIVSASEEFDVRAAFGQIEQGAFSAPSTHYLLTRYRITDYVENLQLPTGSPFQTSLDNSAYVVFSNTAFHVWHV